MEVVELAPDVRPARHLDGDGRLPLLRRVEVVEPGITVRLQQAAERAEVRPRMLALAIWAVAVAYRRWRRSGARAVVAQVDPQPAGFGAAATGVEHRDRRIIGVQLVGGHDVGGDRVDSG